MSGERAKGERGDKPQKTLIKIKTNIKYMRPSVQSKWRRSDCVQHVDLGQNRQRANANNCIGHSPQSLVVSVRVRVFIERGFSVVHVASKVNG